MNCTVCQGEGWVCEDHPDKAWDSGNGCCGAAGAPCVCNPEAKMPPGSTIIWDIERGYLS